VDRIFASQGHFIVVFMKKSPLLPIFLIVVVDVLGLTIILPLLPFYAESMGATPRVVGLLVSAYAICQLIAGTAARASLGSHRPPSRSARQPDGNVRRFLDTRLCPESMAGFSGANHRRPDGR
jgi:hypothetical protein